MRLLTSFCFLCIVLIVSCDNKSPLSINNISPLISWHSEGIILRVSGENCLKWTSSSDSVKLVPIYENKEAERNKCTNTVRAHATGANGRAKGKASSIIKAKGKNHFVTSEVRVGKIEKVTIVTTTRRLFVGLVETLLVQAQDAEDNTFTTLKGLKFKWTTESVDQNGSIELLQVTDESVSLKSDAEEVENGIIGKGVSVGEAKVTVRLDNRFYKHVKPNSVRFHVLDDYQMEPETSLRVLVNTQTQYHLKKAVGDVKQLIEMPSAQHEWIVGNSSIATITPAGLLTSTTLGSTEILVKDKTFPMNEAKGSVKVVAPDHMNLRVRQISEPFMKNMAVDSRELQSEEILNFFVGAEYGLKIELFDNEDEPIHLTDQTKFTVSIDGEATIIDHDLTFQNFSIATPKEGDLNIHVELTGYSEVAITLHQKARVYSHVQISQIGLISLPIDENLRQSYQLTAMGGSGEYSWSSRNSLVVLIDETGLITGIAEGEVEIVVHDKFNPLNGDYRVVRVSIISSIRIKPSIRETTVGDVLCLDVEALDFRKSVFTDISALKPTWKSKNNLVYSPLYGGICPIIGFKAQSIGETVVTVTYRKIKDQVSLAVYPTLMISEPVDPIVTLHSIIEVNVVGGPRKFTKVESEISSYAKVKEEGKVKVTAKSVGSDLKIYEVQCLQLGTFEIEIIQSHSFKVDGYLQNMVSVHLNYVCATPVRMKIAPITQSGSEIPPLQLSGPLQSYNVKNNDSLTVLMFLYTEDGKKFTSFSTFDVNWFVGDTSIAMIEKNLVDQIHLQTFMEGQTTLRAVVSGQRRFSDLSQVQLEGEIELRVTSSIMLTPAWYLIFRHPDNKYTIKATGGSGKFEYSHNTTRIATFRRVESDLEVTGTFEGVLLTWATDVAFGTTSSAVTKIADVSSLEIHGPHLVEAGSSITVILKAFDDQRNEFDSVHFEFMNPTLNADNNVIANVTDKHSKFEYTIYGIQPGSVKMMASVMNLDGKRIHTQEFTVHVYSPLVVEPKELILLPGTTYQVQITGGPSQGQISTTFTVHTHVPSRSTIASVDSHGVVTAKLYGTAILGVEHKFQGSTFARFNIPISVVEPIAIRMPPNATLYPDRCMSLSFHVESSKGIVNLLSLSSFQSSWDSSHSNILFASSESLVDRINPSPVTSAVICATAVLGSTSVTATFHYKHPKYSTKTLQTSTMIIVENKLCANSLCNLEIHLSPNSTLDIIPNRDAATIRSKMLLESPSFSIDRRNLLSSTHIDGVAFLYLEDIIDKDRKSVV